MKKYVLVLPDKKYDKYTNLLNKVKTVGGVSKQRIHEVAIDLICEIQEEEILLRIAKNISEKVK